MTINEAIAKTIKKNGGTCYFHWNGKNKSWCLSGETSDHLVWETDDIEAKTRKEAEGDAVDYLIENNSL